MSFCPGDDVVQNTLVKEFKPAIRFPVMNAGMSENLWVETNFLDFDFTELETLSVSNTTASNWAHLEASDITLESVMEAKAMFDRYLQGYTDKVLQRYIEDNRESYLRDRYGLWGVDEQKIIYGFDKHADFIQEIMEKIPGIEIAVIGPLQYMQKCLDTVCRSRLCFSSPAPYFSWYNHGPSYAANQTGSLISFENDSIFMFCELGHWNRRDADLIVTWEE